jgi:hypothetical protein
VRITTNQNENEAQRNTQLEDMQQRESHLVKNENSIFGKIFWLQIMIR